MFSYYQPGYEVPGTKILGPAFGILSTTTTLRRANDINTLVFTGVCHEQSPTAANPDRPRGTSIDIANLEALAGNPVKWSDALNGCLLHGTMKPADARVDHHGDERHQRRDRLHSQPETRANRGLSGSDFFAVRHSEITIMAITRRDFLRNSACAARRYGVASSIDTFSVVHALTPQAATDYKALVCVFLNGGNDGNNMFVSLDQYDGPPAVLLKATRMCAVRPVSRSRRPVCFRCHPQRWLVWLSPEYARDASSL